MEPAAAEPSASAPAQASSRFAAPAPASHRMPPSSPHHAAPAPAPAAPPSGEWNDRGYNKPGSGAWTDRFTPYSNGEPIKYQDERFQGPDAFSARSEAYWASAVGLGSGRVLSARSVREERKLRRVARQQRINYEKELMWNPLSYRVVPPHLIGLNPHTREPWARDAKIYARKTGSFERVVNADQFGDGKVKRAYNDESALDSHNGYRSHVTATGLKKNASLGGQPLWDSSTRRYCPPALKGLAPITREPWCEDEKFYNRNSTRDTTMDERAGGGALDLGSISHKTRAAARQVDREGFYMPNWEKWSAALSA